MRLKSLTIDQYKNLKDFTLSFDGTSFIDVFVARAVAKQTTAIPELEIHGERNLAHAPGHLRQAT